MEKIALLKCLANISNRRKERQISEFMGFKQEKKEVFPYSIRKHDLNQNFEKPRSNLIFQIYDLLK